MPGLDDPGCRPCSAKNCGSCPADRCEVCAEGYTLNIDGASKMIPLKTSMISLSPNSRAEQPGWIGSSLEGFKKCVIDGKLRVGNWIQCPSWTGTTCTDPDWLQVSTLLRKAPSKIGFPVPPGPPTNS